jgi:glycosyltransferase involved in cell wall biosynthesis
MPNLADLKICFVAGTLGQGGAERQLFYILKSLSEAGARLSLLCLTQGEFWEEKIAALGVPVAWVGKQQNKLARLARIIEVLRKDRPQVLQSQHFYTNLYVTAAARVLGLREVGAMRNDGISEVRANGRILGSMSLRAPRMIAANSRAAIRFAIKERVPAARLKMLPNVVNCERFCPQVNRQKEAVRLIFAGRLVEQKRADRFLSILAQLQNRTSKKVSGLIVGDGPQRLQLEAQARAMGLLPDKLEFKGVVADIGPLYRQSDIFVLTSDWEGTPNVVLEAMASGLPVVATSIGGVPDIVRHDETGFLVNPAHEEKFVQFLTDLINHNQLREELGNNARQYVLANHSFERLPVFLSELYETALL